MLAEEPIDTAVLVGIAVAQVDTAAAALVDTAAVALVDTAAAAPAGIAAVALADTAAEMALSQSGTCPNCRISIVQWNESHNNRTLKKSGLLSRVM